MLLITAADVRAIHDTGRDDAALAPFLSGAETFTDTRLLGKGLALAALKSVQQYVAAHLLYVSDAGIHEALSVEDVRETFTKSKQPGLRDSHFGRMAIMFDTTGTLAAVSELKPPAMLKLVGAGEDATSSATVGSGGVEYPIELPSIMTLPPGPATLYLGPGGWSTTEDDVWAPMTDDGSVIGLFGTVNQNPGAGGITYTLRRAPVGQSGSDQALVAAIAGSTRDFAVDGDVPFVAGDRYAVKVVLGAAVPSADQNLTLRFQRG